MRTKKEIEEKIEFVRCQIKSVQDNKLDKYDRGFIDGLKWVIN